MLYLVRAMDGLLGVFWNSVSSVLLYAFLVKFVNNGHTLQDSNIFVVIALFSLLTFPLGIIPWSVNHWQKCYVSYRRVRRFLRVEEIRTDELVRESPHSAATLISNAQRAEAIVEIERARFTWPQVRDEDFKPQ